MELWALGLIVGSIVAATAAFIWVVLQLKAGQPTKPEHPLAKLPSEAVQQLFTSAFVEEMQGKIRQEFTDSMNKQADDFRAQLVHVMETVHQHIGQQLQQSVNHEFTKYQGSIESARDLLIRAATEGQEALEAQRQTIKQAYEHDLEVRKNHRLVQFEESMADVVTNYVLAAIGSETEGKDQLAAILRELETHKKQIVEDMRNG